MQVTTTTLPPNQKKANVVALQATTFQRFTSQDAADDYECLRKCDFFVETDFQLDLMPSFIQHVINMNGWAYFCAPPGPLLPQLVKEFYAKIDGANIIRKVVRKVAVD